MPEPAAQDLSVGLPVRAPTLMLSVRARGTHAKRARLLYSQQQGGGAEALEESTPFLEYDEIRPLLKTNSYVLRTGAVFYALLGCGIHLHFLLFCSLPPS